MPDDHDEPNSIEFIRFLYSTSCIKAICDSFAFQWNGLSINGLSALQIIIANLMEKIGGGRKGATVIEK